MPVPEFFHFIRPALDLLSDGNIWTNGQVTEALTKKLNLQDDQLTDLIPSGKRTRREDRSLWALVYLRQACLIESVGRGKNRITSAGQQYLAIAPPIVTPNELNRFPEFKAFHSGSRNRTKNEDGTGAPQLVEPDIIDISTTPEERMASAYSQYTAALAQDVLDQIKLMSPSSFESLIVTLMLRLGYGGSREESGETIGGSGDGGVDGVIREDKLGLDSIYLQAKRWDSRVVGRPDVQAFVGALHGHGATKGVFITTSVFSKEAKEYVRMLGNLKLSLVDGSTLAAMMIENDLGVALVRRYDLKRIDSDFFTS